MHSLVKSIKIGNTDEIRKSISSAFHTDGRGRSLSGKNIKMIYIEIVTSLLKELSSLKEVSEKIWNRGFILYQEFDRYSSAKEMEDALIRFSCEICNEMDSVQTNSGKQVIDSVKGYVTANFQKLRTCLLPQQQNMHL